jgi:AraC-like DNA-binding protein
MLETCILIGKCPDFTFYCMFFSFRDHYRSNGMKKLLLWENPPPLRLVVSSRQLTRAEPANHGPSPMHRHSFFELGLVLGGQCIWKIGRRRFQLQSGQAILVKAGSEHCEELSADSGTELAWLGFDFPGSSPTWSERVVTLEDDLQEVALGFQAIYREHSADDPITQRRVGLALQNVLLLVSRRAEYSVPRRHNLDRGHHNSGLNARQVRSVEASAHYFRHNFQETLSIAQVAAYHSFCPAYFSTLFRRHYRMAPRAFLQKVKIENAAELLQTTDLTIKEISVHCGFVDAAHLSKAFKQKHHLTPGVFRRRRRR